MLLSELKERVQDKHYKMMLGDAKLLAEASLNRIIKWHGEDYGFVVLTGFLKGRPDKENERTSQYIVRSFNVRGFGAIKLMGGYRYMKDDPEGKYKAGEYDVEPSFLAVYIPPEFRSEENRKFADKHAGSSWEQFLKIAKEAAFEIGEQESILVKEPGDNEVKNLNRNGETMILGTIKVGTIKELGDYWSKLRKGGAVGTAVGWKYESLSDHPDHVLMIEAFHKSEHPVEKEFASMSWKGRDIHY